MKKLLSASIAAATIAGFAAPAAAVEGLSANVGFVSDYYYRGSNLGDAGAYAGIDYETSGFYIGAWAIDDGGAGNDGIEIDYYLGYGGEAGIFSYSVGTSVYTYDYTDLKDYEAELNFGMGFDLGEGNGSLAVDLAFGQDVDNVVSGGKDKASTQDFAFASVGWSGDVFGVTVGHVEYMENDDSNDDLDRTASSYSYAEFSAGGEVAGLDMGLTIGSKLAESETAAIDGDADDVDNGNMYIFLDISKSFDL